MLYHFVAPWSNGTVYNIHVWHMTNDKEIGNKFLDLCNRVNIHIVNSSDGKRGLYSNAPSDLINLYTHIFKTEGLPIENSNPLICWISKGSESKIGGFRYPALSQTINVKKDIEHIEDYYDGLLTWYFNKKNKSITKSFDKSLVMVNT